MEVSAKPKSDAVWIAALLAVTALVFARMVPYGPLSWDDDANIFLNPHYLSGSWWDFWKESYFGLYIPVTDMVWGVLFRVGGGSAIPFRLLNLGLHLVNVFLFYRLLRALIDRWGGDRIIAIVGTTIFALHPMQVNTVAWLSGGRDLLAVFFALSSVSIYFSEIPQKELSRSRFALSTALFLMSMLCKPSTVVLPLMIIGLTWILDGRLGKSTLMRMALWLIFAFGVFWLTELAQQEYEMATVSIRDRLLVGLDAYSFYLQKFILPIGLTANYARTPEVALSDSTMWASVLMAIAVLVGFSYLAWKQDRRYALIWVWFAALLPVSGFVPFGYQSISTVSDHYAYLPVACLAALTAIILSRVNRSQISHSVSLVLLAFFVGGFAFMAWAKTESWTSDEKFFAEMSKYSPDSYATALGMSIVMCEDLKQYEEGIKWTEVALKAKPSDILALANQAYCYLHAKNYFKVIELEYYLGQMDIDELEVSQPTAYSSLLSSIGMAYIEQQEYEDGFQFLCEAVRVNPSEPGHQANLSAAAEILRSKRIEPTCEQVRPDDGNGPNEPIEEIWPQPEDE